jgi:hypothetical protein
MVKKFLIFVFAISLLVQSRLSWGNEYNFRLTSWGMSQEEVVGSEEKIDPVEKTEHIIKYKTQILGKNVELFYLFAQNKLIGSSYRLDENYLNSRRFIRTYNRFKQALINKYGQPDQEKTNWNNETFKNDRKKLGLALSLGHTEYSSLWNTNNATIECSLRQENYYVLCLIEYRSTVYSHLFEDLNKEDKVDLF